MRWQLTPADLLAYAHAYTRIDPRLAEASWRELVLGNTTNRRSRGCCEPNLGRVGGLRIGRHLVGDPWPTRSRTRCSAAGQLRARPALREAMRLDMAAYDAIPEIAWTATRAGEIDWFNRAWYAYTGLKPSNGDLGHRWVEAAHPDDRELGRQVLQNGRPPDGAAAGELRLKRADGVSRWFRVQVSPVGAPDGGDARLTICTDVDHYKRQGQRFAFIAKAGEILAESLDLETTLERLLSIVVPEFGDWAAIDLLDENDRLKTVAVIHADSRKLKLLKTLRDRYNHRPETEQRIVAILRENRPMILPEISDELIEQAAAPELLKTIRALGAAIVRNHTAGNARPHDRFAGGLCRDAAPL